VDFSDLETCLQDSGVWQECGGELKGFVDKLEQPSTRGISVVKEVEMPVETRRRDEIKRVG
jgi:uncharacterized protein YjaZ